jgi:peptide/nickel transport system permease protein
LCYIHEVLKYIFRRLASSLLVLWVATIGVFLMVAFSGDPLFSLKMNPTTPPKTILIREHQLFLDRSLPWRYWHWFDGLLHGNLGLDMSNAPVRPQLFEHMGVTLRMVVLAFFLAVVIAVSLGVLAALRRGGIIDRSITFTTFFFLATPVFVTGLFLKFYVAIPLDKYFGHQVLSTSGAVSPYASGSFLHRLPDYFAHMTLPTITLILAVFSSWTIYQRSSILETMNLDHVMLARSKGIKPRRVLMRHILRNALIPVTTVLALDFAGLLGGAVITETVYSWNGLGRWFLQGANNQDLNITLAYLLFTAVLVIMFNLLADIAYGFLDPRIRYR